MKNKKNKFIKLCAIVLSALAAFSALSAASCGEDVLPDNSEQPGGGFKVNDDVRVTSVNFTVIDQTSRQEYEKLPLTEIIENAKKCVVTLNVKTDSATSIISGVSIANSADGQDTYVVASHKALAGAKSVTANLNGDFSATDGESKLEFSTDDGTLSPVGSDPQTDVCVVRLNGKLPTAVICDDPDMAEGEPTVAVGNLLSEKTVLSTHGIIASTNYSADAGEGKTARYLLTDAYTKSGAGGGVFYERGGYFAGLIGSLSEFRQTNITCVIPASVIKEVCSAIIKDGYVSGRYKLGISVADNRYSWGITTGVEVTEVSKDGSCYADGGGLRTGDILRSVTFGGTTYSINRAETFLYYVYGADLKVGDVMRFSIERNRTQLVVDVVIKQYNYFDYN